MLSKRRTVGVLMRGPRGPDVDQFNALVKAPGRISSTGELRTVVAANADGIWSRIRPNSLR